MPLTK